MSKIEAELEAELERLGLDMNVSSLDRKLSELVEVSITSSNYKCFSAQNTVLKYTNICFC
jgi:hypothetical protein